MGHVFDQFNKHIYTNIMKYAGFRTMIVIILKVQSQNHVCYSVASKNILVKDTLDIELLNQKKINLNLLKCYL